MTTERKALSPDVVGLELPSSTFDYKERDVMLYALGIGAKELPFIFDTKLSITSYDTFSKIRTSS